MREIRSIFFIILRAVRFFPDGFIIVKWGIFVKYGNYVEVISKRYVCLHFCPIPNNKKDLLTLRRSRESLSKTPPASPPVKKDMHFLKLPH